MKWQRNVVLNVIQRMQDGAVLSAIAAWQDHVYRMRAIKNIARRMLNFILANALARWQEMVPQPSVVDHLLLFGCYLRLWIVHQVTAQLTE